MWDKLAGRARIVKSVGEMKALAQEVAVEVEAGDVLLLYGSLGSGKTVFVQSLARVLGVTDQVTSPTFTVVAEYMAREGLAVERLVHIDLYRLSEKDVSRELSVVEALKKDKRKNAVIIIEWAEKLGDKVVKGAKKIEFEHGKSENVRKVKFVN